MRWRRPYAATPNRPEEPRVSVIVPALNEAPNLAAVLPTLPPVHEVVVIDGGSKDDTVETLARVMPEARLIQQTRRGKGNALVCGFAAATGDVIVMFDADGSADPAEIPAFVEALRHGADVAKGSRYRAGGGSTDLTGLRSLGNRALTLLANVLFGTRYTDLCYGYNAFWRDVVPRLHLPSPEPAGAEMEWGDGFEIETLLNTRFAIARLKVTEVGSYERDRIHGASNLHALRDGIRVLQTMLTEFRWRRRGQVTPLAPATPPAPRTPAPRLAGSRTPIVPGVSPAAAVSVVVPVYRDREHVDRMVGAVLRQTLRPAEVILVDDCGGDGAVGHAAELLHAKGLPPIVVRHDQNRGSGAARNSGLAQASSEWVWFFDADDDADPRMLEVLVQAAIREEAEVATCRTRMVDPLGVPHGIVEPGWPHERVTGRDAARMMLVNQMRGFPCNKVFKRSALPARFFDEGRCYEDFLPMLKLLLGTDRIALVDAPLYRYHERGESMSHRFGEHTLDLLAVGEDVTRELQSAGLATAWRSELRTYHYLNVVLPLANMALRAVQAGQHGGGTRSAVAAARRRTSTAEIARLATGEPRLALSAALLKASPRLYSWGLARR